MKRYKGLILEFSEFNNMRLNSDSAQMAVAVDNPALSINAFDKHEDIIRQAMSKLGTLSKALQNTSGYNSLKSKLSLDEQNISNLKIIRIITSYSKVTSGYILPGKCGYERVEVLTLQNSMLTCHSVCGGRSCK